MTCTISRTTDLAACHALRRIVFIEEQGVSEDIEVDGRDGDAVHILAVVDDAPVGCARMLVQGHTAKIGRVCVLPNQRGTGLGAAIIRTCLEIAGDVPGVTRAKLGAQTHALAFYERLGFTAVGPEFEDAGIPHRNMERAL